MSMKDNFEEKKPMDRKKKIIIGGAAAVIAVAAAILIAVFMPKAEIEVDPIDVESGEYLAVNVPKNYEFQVEGADSVEVKDIHGEDAGCRISEGDGSVKVKAPSGGYEKGDIYRVELGEGESFLNEELQGVTDLTFVIESKNRSVVEYTDRVEQLKADEATLEGDRLTLEGSYSDGDIVAVDADGNGAEEIYELTDARKDSGSTVAGFRTPDVDPEEIYEELDIFYYDYVDFSELEIDEEAFRGVLNETGIMDAFIDDAYAAGSANIEVNVKETTKDSFTFEVILTDPKDSARTLTLDFSLKKKILVKNDDDVIYASARITIGNDLTFAVKGSDKDSTEASIKKALENYEGNKGGKNKESDYEVPLVPIEIPLGGPVTAVADLGLVAEVGYSAEYNAGIDTEVTFNTGIVFDREKKKVTKKYAEVTGDAGASMCVKGSLSAFAGGYLKLGVSIPVVAQVDISGKFGPYMDAEGCFTMDGIPDEIETEGYYKMELGLMGKADAGLEVLKIYEKDFSLMEKKIPLYEYGDYLKVDHSSLATSYQKDDEGIDIGDVQITYRNVINDKKIKKKLKDYTLSIDGKEVDVVNGVIKDDLSLGKHTFTLEWEYKDKKYKRDEKISIVEAPKVDFDETIWAWGRGQTMGTQNYVVFHLDGTFSEYFLGSGETELHAGTYRFESGALYMTEFEDVGLGADNDRYIMIDEDSFRSPNEVPMQVGTGYQTISRVHEEDMGPSVYNVPWQ